jgi:hypothetical protein
MERQVTHDQKERNRVAALWLIIGAMSLAFLLYGLVMFLVIGDKGPPAWDFGAVQDTPGKSTFSTFPTRGGDGVAPAPQHVGEKPPVAGKPSKERGG